MKTILPFLEKAIFPIRSASVSSLFLLPRLYVQDFLESNKTNFFKTTTTPDGSIMTKNVPQGNIHLKIWSYSSPLEVKPVTAEKSEIPHVDFALPLEN